MKRILINAEQPNEVRVAYLEDGKLVDFEIESSTQTSVKGNIYIGVITAVKTDLEGAFVDIGEERHGLLAFSKAGGRGSRDTRTQESDEPVEIEHPDLQVGQKVLVQVFREARGEKGSALSMELSLPGRFIVLKPNSNVRAVTRNVSEVQRMRLRELGNQLPNVENVGWIMRTTAVNHTLEEITSDFHRLMNLWRNVQHAYEENQQHAPVLVYSDNTLMQRVLRDRLRRDGTKVIVDDPSLYRESRSYASDFMPELRDQIEHYRGDRPIFDTFRVENDVASLFSRKVTLPSGGELVFDPTEALLSIDVNSAKNTGGETLEETALHTNLEAAAELCRQLMIRNIGGLIIVDFIDMLTEGYNEQVEQVVRECLSKDTANSECTAISEFGLMQLNRQRRRSSIYDTHFEECEHCQGGRFVRRAETNANQVLRKLSYLIHDPSRQENQYLCRVPDEVAAYILNKERQYLRDLELNTRKQVIVIADSTLSNDKFDIKSRRVKGIDYEGGSNLEELLHQSRQDTLNKARAEFPDEPRANPQPLVSPVDTKKPKKKKQKSTSKAVAHPKKKQNKNSRGNRNKGTLSRFFTSIFGIEEKKTPKRNKKASRAGQKRSPSQTKRKDAPQSNPQGRKIAASGKPRTGKNKNDQRGNTRSTKREEKSQRENVQGSSAARAPRRDRNPNREKNVRTSRSTTNAESNKSKAPSDKVRRAADLKQSADAAAREARKSDDVSNANRRAPRSNRAVGSNGKRNPERQRGREQSVRKNDRARDLGNQESKQPQEFQDGQQPRTQGRTHRQDSEPTRRREPVNRSRPRTEAELSSRSSQDAPRQNEATRQALPESNDERVSVTRTEPTSSKPVFAANDPRARRQQPAIKEPKVSQNESAQESARSDNTQSEINPPRPSAHRPMSEISEPTSGPSSTEPEQAPEQTAPPQPVSEPDSVSPSRPANDPRSRVSGET